MLLVVDANIVISALIARASTLELLFSKEIELVAPDLLFTEVDKYKNLILTKSGLAEEEVNTLMVSIMSKIRIMEFFSFEGFFEKAKEISPDPEDIQYFALALKLDAAIWSNEKRLKKQSAIKVFSTEDLVNMLGL